MKIIQAPSNGIYEWARFDEEFKKLIPKNNLTSQIPENKNNTEQNMLH